MLARLRARPPSKHRFGRPAGFVLAATLTAAIAGGCGSASSSGPTPARHTALESIFEAPQLYTAPGPTLDTLRRLGVSRVRVDVTWGDMAPNPSSATPPSGFRGGDPAAYPAAKWAVFDAIVRAARTRGIGVDMTFDPPPPLWAAARGGPPFYGTQPPQWRPSPRLFAAFVHAVAIRYDGSYTPAGESAPLPRVSFWSVWNEPNYGPDLAPQATHHSTVEVSPALYRRLVDAAWRALQSTGHGPDTVLIGELAPRGITVGNSPGNYSGMVPLRFVRALYCVDEAYHPLRGAAAAARKCPVDAAGSAAFPRLHRALFQAGGFSDHPYPQALPPDVATPGEPDFADLPQIPKLVQVLDTIQRDYGSSRRLQIYSTEYGYKTNPPEALAGAVTPAQAAVYLNWAEYISWRNPRISSYDQYLLTDPPAGNFATGLEFANGAPKPGLAAFRMPIYLPQSAASAGTKLEVWGCVRPARYARLDTGSAQRVEIQFGHDGAFHTVQTVPINDPYGYVDVRQAFSTTGDVRLMWRYPHGPAIFSRTVHVVIR